MKVMVAPYTVTGEAFRPGAAQPWGNEPRVLWSPFDVSRDGKRLLVLADADGQPRGAPSAQLMMRFNLLEELRRRVPAGR